MGRIVLVVAILLIGIPVSAQDSGKVTFAPADMKTEDRADFSELMNQANALQKDIEIANTRLALARSMLQRISEVQLPNYVAALRKKYNLPESEWDFDPASWFTKRSGPKKP